MGIKRNLLVFLVICVSIALIAGCGAGQKGTGSSTPENASEGTSKEPPITISYGLWDKSLQPIYRKIADEFEKAHSNITVNVDVSPWNEYWTKLEAAATGGTLPDVFWMNGPNIVRYAEANILMPIDDRLAKDNVDMTNYPQSLVKLYTVEGKNYTMPLFWDTAALWYNKEIFDNAGVPYPDDTWDFEKLKEVAAQLTDKSKDIYGIAAKMHNQGVYYNTILQAGGFIISEDRKTSGFDKPETIEGIKVWPDLINEGLSPTFQQMLDTSQTSLFESGKLAMIYDGSWMYPQYSKNDYLKDKLGITVMPKLKQRGAVLHGVGAAISAKTKNPDAAWKFMEFLGSQEANDIFAQEQGGLPAYLPSVDVFVEQETEKGYNVKAFLEQVEYATMYPCSKYTSKWQEQETKYLKRVWAGEMSAEEACKKIAEEMNRILATE